MNTILNLIGEILKLNQAKSYYSKKFKA